MPARIFLSLILIVIAAAAATIALAMASGMLGVLGFAALIGAAIMMLRR
ncbi:hypothetical protein [Falsirhodobacter sp. alg1]|nr:hypothetical protein [Falsirhodobacter sp. alg1]